MTEKFAASKAANPTKANKNKNKKTLIILGLFAGAVLILLSFITNNNGGSSGNKNAAGLNTTNELPRTEAADYITEQEKKLREMLNRIDGVSEAFVMITLESSGEYVYASKQNSKESISRDGDTTQKEMQKDIILVEDEKRSKSPLLVKEIQPKVRGVAVVCKGISSAEMQLKIINLVSAALNIPSNKIYIVSAD